MTICNSHSATRKLHDDGALRFLPISGHVSNRLFYYKISNIYKNSLFIVFFCFAS